MANTMNLEVITSSRIAYTGDVTMVVVRAIDGDIGLLPKHIPIIAALDIGILKIFTEKGQEKMAISGGILHKVDNKIIIMTATAEKALDIDIIRAKYSLNRAKEKLTNEQLDSREKLVWDNARKRAQIRINIAKN